MMYLAIKLWPYVALAFLTGFAIAWITCRWDEE